MTAAANQVNDRFYHIHPIFNYGAEMNAICRPLFELLNINYFNYSYYDKSNHIFTGLTTDPAMVEHGFKNCVSIAGTVKDKGSLLWQAYIQDDYRHDFKRLFKHDNGVSIFKKQRNNHIEYIDLAASPENTEILLSYINHGDLVDNFFNYFLNEASSLIEKSKKYPIHLGDIMRGEKFPEDKSLADLMKNKDDTVLTKQQKAVLIHIVSGMTVKEAAESLQLAARTVEHYLDSVKEKLNCTTKHELFKKALKIIDINELL